MKSILSDICANFLLGLQKIHIMAFIIVYDIIPFPNQKLIADFVPAPQELSKVIHLAGVYNILPTG